MEYRREIDGLRAIAVVSVILFHAGFQAFSGGYVGVDVFFVISGFLITSIILSERKSGKFSLVNFYERRARRILPALFFVMFACLPFAWLWLLPADMESFSQSMVAITAFISNIFFWSERGYFGTAVDLKPLLHTWSLGIEEQYYFIFPLLLIFLLKRRQGFAYITLAAIGVVSLLSSVWLTRVHVDSAFYLLPTRFWELLMGSFVALVRFNGGGTKTVANTPDWRSEALGALGLALIIGPVFFFSKNTLFPGYAVLLPTVGTALIIHYSGRESLTGRLLGNRPLVGIGLISYSAYLWHQPLFAFARHQNGGNEPDSLVFAALIFATLALSYLSWRYIENPFRNKALYSRKRIFALSLVFLVFFAAIGIIGWKSGGLLYRYSPEDQRLLKNFNGAGPYVSARFDDLKLRDFDPEHSKKRVIVIGDSYGKDLVNAIFESEMSDKLDITTHQINSECGNLFLDFDFTGKIEEGKLPRCKVLGWYDNARLVDLINESDEIWLASSWNMWVAELLPQSVENLKSRFGKKVLVFGTKDFGRIDAKVLLGESGHGRYSHVEALKETFPQVNGKMRSTLPADAFIDLSGLLCADDFKCRIFDGEQNLISFDGGHLTKNGAIYLGRKLSGHPLLRN